MLDFIGDILKSPIICIGWLIVGAVAGGIARSVMGSKSTGCVTDLVLGLVGAFVGGIVISLFGLYKPDGGLSLVLVNLIVAVVGACILIAVGRLFMGRRAQ